MPFRLLHISDMHFGPRCCEQNSDFAEGALLVCDNLVESLRSMGPLRINSIVFSGDFKVELLDQDASEYGVTDELILWERVLAEVQALGSERAEMILAYLEGIDTEEIYRRFSVTKSNLYSVVSRFRSRVRPLLSGQKS